MIVWFSSSSRLEISKNRFWIFHTNTEIFLSRSFVRVKTTFKHDQRYYKNIKCHAFLSEWQFNSSLFVFECSVALVDLTRSIRMLAFCSMFCFFNYQKSFFNVFSKRSIWSSLVINLLTCLNCNNFFMTKKNFNTYCVETKLFENLIKFVIRLFIHIFFRSSYNLEYFNNVCCIICRDNLQKQFKEFATFILYK